MMARRRRDRQDQDNEHQTLSSTRSNGTDNKQQARTTRTTSTTNDNNNNLTQGAGAQPPTKLRAQSGKQHTNKQRPTTTAQNPTTARQDKDQTTRHTVTNKGEKAAGEEPKRTPRVSERKGEAREREREMLNIQ